MQNAGIEILAGIDVEPTYLQTFKVNFPNAIALGSDLSTIAPEDIMCQVGIVPGGLTILAGGPPCQGFSKNVPRSNRYLEDPKNQLVAAFLRFAEAARPRFVLMENVAEMKAGFDGAYTALFMEVLEKRLGYSVNHSVINATDHGVPQRRRRAFFLASRDNERTQFPTPSHVATVSVPTLFEEDRFVSVWDAIGDLPELEHGQGSDPSDYADGPQNKFQFWARQGSERVRNHIARKLQPVQFERLSSIEPGQGLKDLPDHIRPQSGYSGAYGRLTKGMIAPTITRWVFHPGSGRYGHPTNPRVITIREAARLQAFPDRFNFVGSYIQQGGQIGNAVPPLLAEKIGRELMGLLPLQF